jgi:hypothetical protein
MNQQPPETGEFLRQLGAEENDIVISILAATHLETLIDLVLDEVLVPGRDAKGLRKQQASRKIGLLFALGLLTEGSRNDLDVILDIRNHFAHRVFGGTATFSDAELEPLIAKLSPSTRQEDWTYVPAYLRLGRYEPGHPRAKFLSAVLACAWELVQRRKSQPQATPAQRLEPPNTNIIEELEKELGLDMVREIVERLERKDEERRKERGK